MQRLPAAGGPVGLLEAFDDAVDFVRGGQQISQRGVADARQHPFKLLFLDAPDAVFAQGHRHGPACGDGIFDALQAANIFAQGPMHQHFGFTLGLQAVKHARHAHGLAAEYGFGQFEDVVTRHIKNRVFDLVKRQDAIAGCALHRVKQRQFLDFLVRRQQVAFHPVREKLQRALAFLASCHALALHLQTLRNPLRQIAALDRIKLDADTKAVERAKPGALGGHAVKARQHDQRQRRVIALRALGNLLQGHRAVLARLAAGNTDFDNLFVGKQAQRTAAGQHRAPVKMGASHGVHGALCVALLARLKTQGIGKLLQQQRLVAVQCVQAFQPALEVLCQLGGCKIHG